MTVSTHILDTAAGRPAAGVSVELSLRDDDGRSWRSVETGVTDADGRIRFAAETVERRVPADLRHRPVLLRSSGCVGFYPEVVITFSTVTLEGAPGHYHVPLLLSPYSYSTYRGS